MFLLGVLVAFALAVYFYALFHGPFELGRVVHSQDLSNNPMPGCINNPISLTVTTRSLVLSPRLAKGDPE